MGAAFEVAHAKIETIAAERGPKYFANETCPAMAKATGRRQQLQCVVRGIGARRSDRGLYKR